MKIITQNVTAGDIETIEKVQKRAAQFPIKIRNLSEIEDRGKMYKILNTIIMKTFRGLEIKEKIFLKILMRRGRISGMILV
jgi:hypothetical protein